MKKLLFKMTILSFMVLVFSSFVKITLPYYWGNEIIKQKVEYLNNQDNEFDVLFVGSSKTYRHISPAVFDSLTNLNSFNLGSPATFHLETHYLVDNYLNSINAQKSISVFFQNMALVPISDKNLHTNRSKYFIDYKRMKLGVNYFLNKEDYEQVYRHIISYLENLFCIGELEDILCYHLFKDEKLNEIMINQKGFYSLDQELENSNSQVLLNRHSNYKKNKSLQRKRRKLSEKRKNITIKEIGVTSFNLKANDFFSFYRIKPNILLPELYFDKGHFNTAGAESFTRMLADKVNAKLK